MTSRDRLAITARPAGRGTGNTPAFGWVTTDVSFRYPGTGRPAVQSVSVSIAPGSCTAVIGPNGSGKSTLLKLLLGSLPVDSGSVEFAGRPIRHWSRRELAQTIGVVPQNEEISFPLTVEEMVAMGRYPHLGLLRPHRQGDRLAIEHALSRCDVGSVRGRSFDTLSGGERQRVRIARALAQEPSVLALDEPTRELDVRHEMEIFELVRALAAGGVTVLLVTHNLNLAARYADTLLLLDRGRVDAIGPPPELLVRERLESVYGWPLRTTTHPGPGRDTGAVQVTPLAADGLP